MQFYFFSMDRRDRCVCRDGQALLIKLIKILTMSARPSLLVLLEQGHVRFWL